MVSQKPLHAPATARSLCPDPPSPRAARAGRCVLGDDRLGVATPVAGAGRFRSPAVAPNPVPGQRLSPRCPGPHRGQLAPGPLGGGGCGRCSPRPAPSCRPSFLQRRFGPVPPLLKSPGNRRDLCRPQPRLGRLPCPPASPLRAVSSSRPAALLLARPPAALQPSLPDPSPLPMSARQPRAPEPGWRG